MRHLSKPQLPIGDILQDCANSYRSTTQGSIKERLQTVSDYIQTASEAYDNAAQNGNWHYFQSSDTVNGILTKEEMCDVYNSKFVKCNAIRTKYYDHLMTLAVMGKCPICGIGQVSTLDHYLAKTVYPTYAITPYNLIPVCKDCNFEKLDSRIDPNCAPLHPYYDDIDSYVWLICYLSMSEGGITAVFEVNEQLEKDNFPLFQRLTTHFRLYSLGKSYSIQAATEIAENHILWRDMLLDSGDSTFINYLHRCLESKETYQRNTWNTALLRALIDNPYILSD